jgi:ketol-acid reductoisomerase
LATIYRDHDADVSLLSGATIAVIGYGNQGRAQALNLRDSGCDVLVGCPPDAYRERAIEDGLRVFDPPEAARQADVVLMLVPDEIQAELHQQALAPALRQGSLLCFASGYNIYFKLIQPPAFVDVVMVAPRMIGSAVRSRFVAGQGFPCLVAVAQDATGRAHGRMLALARAIGGTRDGAFASSFEEEVLIDLFAEQFLWAGIGKLCRLYFGTLVQAGCIAETVATEMYLSGEMVEVAKAMLDEGFFKQLDLHSQTSQYGQLSRADRVLGPDAAARARLMLEAIRNGDFAREWAAEQGQGKPVLHRLKAAALAHPLNEIERKLRWSGPDG